MRTRTKQASTTHETEPCPDLRLRAALLPGRRQSYRCRPIQKRKHLHIRRRFECRPHRRLSSHGLVLSVPGYRPFLTNLLTFYGDWTHGVITTAALDSHSIGVLSDYPLHPGRLSDLFCFHLDSPGQDKQPRFPVHHLCLHSIPDVVAPLAPTCFSSNSKELAGYPFAFAGIGAAPYCGLASFVFLCHSSQLGSFYDPEELKHCSCTFSGQSKKHHANTYHPGLRAFDHHHQHDIFPIPKCPTLPNWHTSANRLTLHCGFRLTLWRLRLLLTGLVLLPLFDVSIHLSLPFPAG